MCDYLEGHGANVNNLGYSPLRRVRWRKTHNEYQCEDCFRMIRESRDDQRQRDNERKQQQQIPEDAPAMSDVLVE